MYRGLEKHTYDHTTAILNAWSKQPVKNPYRSAKFVEMTPSELHAITKAIEARNKKRQA